MLPQRMRAGIPLPHKLRGEAVVRTHSYRPGGPRPPGVPATALGRAARETIQLLVAARADPHRKNAGADSPLDAARKSRSRMFERWLGTPVKRRAK